MRKFKSKTIEGKIDERINEIISSFSRKQQDTKEMFLTRFANKDANTLYKHIPDYSKAKLVEKLEEDYVVNVGVWQEYLVREWLDKIDLTQIPSTDRRSELYKKDRGTTDVKNDGKISREKHQCISLVRSHNTALGDLKDFQVPLKARKGERNNKSDKEYYGELDMVATQLNEMILIEYKIPDSTEPLLRAVLEAITYYYQIDGANPQNSRYLQLYNETFSTQCDKIGIAIVVPRAAYRYGHRRAYELIKEYNIICYTFEDGENFESIIKLDDKQIFEYAERAAESLQGIYCNSDKIVASLKLK